MHQMQELPMFYNFLGSFMSAQAAKPAAPVLKRFRRGHRDRGRRLSR